MQNIQGNSSLLRDVFLNDRFAKYYNLTNLENVFLTTDVDWAPDFAIEDVLGLVQSFNFKITVFTTHYSQVLKSTTHTEIGLHPDYTRPSKEDPFRSKLMPLKEYYPDAVGVRSHRNLFGQNISDISSEAGLIYDASTFLWKQPFCQIHVDYNNLIRFSYMWEDGIHADTNQPWEIDSIGLHTPGLKILNVHPILIYLNCPDDNYRREVTKSYSDLTKASYNDLKKQIYPGYGFRSFYKDILSYLANKNLSTHLLKEAARI